MPNATILRKLLEYKASANDELLTALKQLDRDAPATEIALRTLSHMFIVDRIFAAHMNRTGHAYESANASAAPVLAKLSEEIRASDHAFVAYVSNLDDDQLAEHIAFTFTDGEPGRMSREEMLMHVVVHGGYHRGQVAWMMTLEGATPPPDGFTSYLHKAEPATRRRSPRMPTAAPAVAPLESPTQAGREPLEAKQPRSRIQILTERLREGVARGLQIEKSVKFDLKDEGCIFIGNGQVTNENRVADLTLTISIDDLRAIGQGKLSPMGAATTGRLRLSDMGLALSLQKKLKALFANTA